MNPHGTRRPRELRAAPLWPASPVSRGRVADATADDVAAGWAGTCASFAPFGTVIAQQAGGHDINDGSAWRHEAIGDLDLNRADGRGVLALYQAQARRFPFMAVEMERHLLSEQVFLPLGQALQCVLLVAPAALARPGEADCQAFITQPGQGVSLRAGTWHHALLSVQAGPWAVLERRARGGGVDCDVHRWSHGVLLAPP